MFVARPISPISSKNLVDMGIGVPYNAFIDGGAANEQRARSLLRLD
jgi:hypothetical protein